jgi:hypothetical protein
LTGAALGFWLVLGFFLSVSKVNTNSSASQRLTVKSQPPTVKSQRSIFNGQKSKVNRQQSKVNGQ